MSPLLSVNCRSFTTGSNAHDALRPAVSNRKEGRNADDPCTPIRDTIPQTSDPSRADTSYITFEIGYHHRRATETSDSLQHFQLRAPAIDEDE